MKRQLSKSDSDKILEILKTRFDKNTNRHPNITWEKVQSKLEQSPEKLWSINEMEVTEGEPDVVEFSEKDSDFFFVDCSTETPKRRSLCYDKAAWDSRKENKPANNAMDVATQMGIEILDEEKYRQLQTLGEFDRKTSSWVKTPDEIRKLGGAIFCDRRYNHVFTYHNGAESYYAARGFRGILKI